MSFRVMKAEERREKQRMYAARLRADRAGRSAGGYPARKNRRYVKRVGAWAEPVEAGPEDSVLDRFLREHGVN